jgi:hypothetical protein
MLRTRSCMFWMEARCLTRPRLYRRITQFSQSPGSSLGKTSLPLESQWASCTSITD